MLSNFSSYNNRTEKEVGYVYIVHHFVPELMEVSK
jgi:hypothetical protein